MITRKAQARYEAEVNFGSSWCREIIRALEGNQLERAGKSVVQEFGRKTTAIAILNVLEHDEAAKRFVVCQTTFFGSVPRKRYYVCGLDQQGKPFAFPFSGRPRQPTIAAAYKQGIFDRHQV